MSYPQFSNKQTDYQICCYAFLYNCGIIRNMIPCIMHKITELKDECKKNVNESKISCLVYVTTHLTFLIVSEESMGKALNFS